MNGRDFRDVVSQGCDTGTLVLFEDAEGHLHEITTCLKTRGEYKDYFGSLVILRETCLNDFLMRIIPPPPEIQNELYRLNKAWDGSIEEEIMEENRL